MTVLPIALVLFGYWVMYAGAKRVSLGDAWACVPQATPTQGPQGSNVSVTPIPGGPSLGVTTDCTPRPGDTRLPNGFLWRPLNPNLTRFCLPIVGCINIPQGINQALAGVNGQLLGPC